MGNNVSDLDISAYQQQGAPPPPAATSLSHVTAGIRNIQIQQLVMLVWEQTSKSEIPLRDRLL